ncbi:MAG: N-acetyltransferase [Rhodovibrionaceae bacterium]|nr:N-acetyltransferase [Rhodovibrionaceae bacterium]
MIEFHIVQERPEDAALLPGLLDRTFGRDRHVKTVYRLREGVEPVSALCFSAVGADSRLLASLRFWPVSIAGEAAILLGPLAVEPSLQGRGIGRALVRHGLGEAKTLGYRICIVVGEPAYYAPYGFRPATPEGLFLPGPVDPPRFQVMELSPGALEGVKGLIGRAPADSRPLGRETSA